MKKLLFVLALGFLFLLIPFSSAIANPAATFCEKSGHKYIISKNADGSEQGYCKVGGLKVDSWDYYKSNHKKSDLKKTTTEKTPSENKVAVAPKIKSLSKGPAKEKGFIVSAPTNFDWRSYISKDWTTGIRDQGSCGSCWAFSSVGVVESKVNINLNNASYDPDLSEQDIITNSNPSESNCDGGYVTDGLDYLKNTGIVKESCMPYTQSNSGTMCEEGSTEKTKIGNYVVVSASLNSIKTAISSYGPVTAYMVVCDDFSSFSGSGIYNHPGDVYWDDSCWHDGGDGYDYLNWHAISIAGYNDSGSYLVVRNSWGTGWGDNGYIKISYAQTITNYLEWEYNVYISEDGDNRTFFIDESYYVTTTDSDIDGVLDGVDNCPDIQNQNQSDKDEDGIGDVCDDFCNPLLQNSSWSSWQNVTSCRINDTLLQNRSLTQTDLHQCGSPQIISEDRESSCNYCAYSILNSSWSEWQNVSAPSCSLQDIIAQNRTRIEYDANYTSCYAVTELPSDLWNGGENITHLELQNLTCDFCLPNWTKISENDKIWFNDSNICYEQTNLTSDLSNRPINISFESSENLTSFLNNEADDSVVLEVNFNFSEYLDNFSSFKILDNAPYENYSWVIISGLNLSINSSFQKIIYFDKKLNTSLICIKDAEIEDISEISVYCNSSLETLFNSCPKTIGNYSCEISGNRYKITGMSHSAVREQSTFCGDGLCNGAESCSSCSADCGNCKSSGGGGGGTPTKTYEATSNALSEGYNAALKKGDKITFQSTSGSHTLTTDSIGTNFADITIQSSPINLKLFVGEDRKLNLSSSDYYELYVKLESISAGKANITLKSIYERIISLEESTPKINQTAIGEENKTATSTPAQEEKTITGWPVYVIALVVFGLILGVIYLLVKIIRKRKFGYNI